MRRLIVGSPRHWRCPRTARPPGAAAVAVAAAARRPGRGHPGLCVLASGDPMLHGIGATLARRLGPRAAACCPAVSSVALACARLGWAEHEVEVVSLVSRPAEAACPRSSPGRGCWCCAAMADAGRRWPRCSPSAAGPPAGCPCWSASAARRSASPAPTQRRDPAVPGPFADLCVAGARPRAARRCRRRGRPPGLPDDAFETDGQLTRRELRALALAALAARARAAAVGRRGGQRERRDRVDAGRPAGCGAIAVEPRPDRAQRIRGNARAGRSDIEIVCGAAPDALAELPRPDAVFVGGGVSAAGVLDACWKRAAVRRAAGRARGHRGIQAVLHGSARRRSPGPAGRQLPAAGPVHHLAAGAAGDPMAGDRGMTV